MSATGRRGQGKADVVTFITIGSDRVYNNLLIKGKLQVITRKITCRSSECQRLGGEADVVANAKRRRCQIAR